MFPEIRPPSSLNRRKLRNRTIFEFNIAFHLGSSTVSKDWLLVADSNWDVETKKLRSQIVSHFERERYFIRWNVLRAYRHFCIELVELVLHTGAGNSIGTCIKEYRRSDNDIGQNRIHCHIDSPGNNTWNKEEENDAGLDGIIKKSTNVRDKQSQLKFWALRSVWSCKCPFSHWSTPLFWHFWFCPIEPHLQNMDLGGLNMKQ